MPPTPPTPINGKICYLEMPALDIRRSAGGDGRVRLRTRNAEAGTRNRGLRLSRAVPRSPFALPHSRTPPAAPPVPRHRVLPARSTGTTPPSR